MYDLGDALGWVGEARPAFTAFNEAVGVASESGDASLEWLARIRRASMQMLTDPRARATEDIRGELEEAARRFEALGDERALAVAWNQLAWLEWMPCRYERAERAANKAVGFARRSGDQRLLQDAIATLLFAQLYAPGTPDQGLRSLESVIDDVSGSRQMESMGLYVRAFYAGLKGSLDEARTLMGRAIEIADATGLRLMAAVCYEELADLELWAGEAAAAERASRRHYEILDELGDDGRRSTAAANLALALCSLERFDEAEPFAEIAVRVAAEDDLISQVNGRAAQATVLAAREAFADAEELAREAVEMFAEAEAPDAHGVLWMTLARILRSAGKTEQAESAAREALALYERKGNRPATASTRAFIKSGRSP